MTLRASNMITHYRPDRATVTELSKALSTLVLRRHGA
jgi:hypothetical protein